MIKDIDVARKMANISSNADKRGIEFNMSFSKTKRLMKQTKCSFTGVPFEPSGDNASSFDRLDNNKGYTDDNIVACTVRVNRFKANLSIDEIKGIHKQIVKRL